MADFGIKSSKVETDVIIVKPFDSVLSSSFNLYKIRMQGMVSSGVGAGVTLDHSLGYRPFFLCWTNDPKQVAQSLGVTDQRLDSGLFTNLNNVAYYIFYAPSV